MMKKALYRNKRNANKYIELVRYGCGHYYAIQKMIWGDVVSSGGRRSRFNKDTIDSILEDYEEVTI